MLSPTQRNIRQHNILVVVKTERSTFTTICHTEQRLYS